MIRGWREKFRLNQRNTVLLPKYLFCNVVPFKLYILGSMLLKVYTLFIFRLLETLNIGIIFRL